MVDYYSPLVLSLGVTNTADQYFIPVNTGLSGSATESQRQSKLYDAYDAEGIFINVSVNGDTANRPFTLRNGGSNTALSATITASTTGIFQDNTNSVSIASGDLLSFLYDRSNSNSVTIRSMGMFLVSPQPVNKASSAPFLLGGTSITRYYQVPGDGAAGTTEADRHKIVVPVDCVISNFYAYIPANPRTSTTTITLRKNSVDQSPVLTIPAATTGFVEDTTNTVSYTAGDNYSVKLVIGSGTGSIQFTQIGFDIVNDDAGSFTQILAGTGAFASTATVHRGTALGGRLNSVSGLSAADAQVPMRGDSTLRKFRMYIQTNSSTVSTIIDLEVNGVLAGMVLVIPPSTTGIFSDTTTEISITNGDLVNLYGVSTAGSGTKSASWFTYEIDQDLTPPPVSIASNSLIFWF